MPAQSGIMKWENEVQTQFAEELAGAGYEVEEYLGKSIRRPAVRAKGMEEFAKVLAATSVVCTWELRYDKNDDSTSSDLPYYVIFPKE